MKKIILILSVAVVLLGCKPENKAIAKVAGQKITQGEFDLELERITKLSVPQDYEMTESDTLTLKKQVLETLIQKKMFGKKMDDLKIEADEDEVQKMTEEVISQYGSEEKMLEDLEDKGFTLDELKEEFRYRNRLNGLSKYIDEMESASTEEELLEYYNENKERNFTRPGNITARHILIKIDTTEEEALGKINSIKGEIENGLDFAEAAKKYSQGPSSENGGMLPPFTRGQMVEPFYQAALISPINAVSEPVLTDFGYHIIYVEARTEDYVASFEETKEFIKAQVKQIQFLEQIEEDAKIKRPEWAEDK